MWLLCIVYKKIKHRRGTYITSDLVHLVKKFHIGEVFSFNFEKKRLLYIICKKLFIAGALSHPCNMCVLGGTWPLRKEERITSSLLI